jgi:DNA-binding transcriptional MerR regulator
MGIGSRRADRDARCSSTSTTPPESSWSFGSSRPSPPSTTSTPRSRIYEAVARPVAFYSDKHSIFRVHREGTGGRAKGVSQFGRALAELNIDILCANSPQAKGRVERPTAQPGSHPGPPQGSLPFCVDPGMGSRVQTQGVPKPESRVLRIGQLAQQCGLSRDSLRHYERLGLLPKPTRTAGGFREYSNDVPRRVTVIQRALAMGFTLAELSAIFQERAAGRSPCRQVRALAGEKLRQLELTLAELHRLRGVLRRTLAAWDVRLEQTGTGRPASLLESLADGSTRARATRNASRPLRRRVAS